MSSAKQESSPAQQRHEIEALAGRMGFEIVGWYIDEGISGDEIEKRPGFRRMLADATAGKFQVILCWDQDRFGRFDSLKAGFVVEPLRAARVRLVTVAQGEIDWNDFTGRMMYAIQQEGKNQYLINLSRDSLRGRMKSAREGHGVSRAPFGYDRVFVDPAGRVVHRTTGDVRFTKPREWKARLDISADAQAVEAVRFMFDRYANSDANCRSIAYDLNQRGVRTFRGRLWEGTAVRCVLENPAYLGRLVTGRTPRGRFHRIGSGNIGGDGPIVVENSHPPLVDAATFRKVQQKLAKRSQPERTRSNDYLLSGLLVSGHSGDRLKGQSSSAAGNRYYTSFGHSGDLSGPLQYYRVRKEPLERFVINRVADLLNRPGIEDRLRAAVAARMRARPKANDCTPAIKAKLAALDRKIAQGTERLLLVEAEHLADASAALTAWRTERRRLADDLATASGETAIADEMPVAMGDLAKLRASFASADPAVVRAALHATIADITLFWDTSAGAHKRRPLQRGVIRFASESAVVQSAPSR